jgi:hypothetical protein
MTQNAPAPPLAKWLFANLINPIMRTILRSPLHSILSRQLLLLTFTGLKSGKQYTTPVGYDRDGDRLTLFTASPWWKNFESRAPVTVRVRGETLTGQAESSTDPETVARAIQVDLETRGVQFVRRRHRLNLPADGDPSLDDIINAFHGKTLIRIDLDKNT